jgi:hypothetical protein
MTFDTPALQQSIESFAETYRKSSHHLEFESWLAGSSAHHVREGYHQMSLTPTLFWYDNTHVCDTAHYRDFIFNPQYQMVARGGFVEDKLSPVLKRSVDRLGLREGHSRFGCYILDDHSGYFFTGHLDGGSYRGSERTSTQPSSDSQKNEHTSLQRESG